jgi:hypothetical protein
LAGELEDRVGFSRATLRKVNDGMRRNGHGGPGVFVCECGRIGCNQLVELGAPEYEALRGHHYRFLLLKGHELPECDEIVASHNGYVVVHDAGGGDTGEGTWPLRSPDS